MYLDDKSYLLKQVFGCIYDRDLICLLISGTGVVGKRRYAYFPAPVRSSTLRVAFASNVQCRLPSPPPLPRLVAEYLVKAYPQVKLGIAGRSENKCAACPPPGLSHLLLFFF